MGIKGDYMLSNNLDKLLNICKNLSDEYTNILESVNYLTTLKNISLMDDKTYNTLDKILRSVDILQQNTHKILDITNEEIEKSLDDLR